MENTNRTQQVIDALLEAGIKAVKIDAPIFGLNIGNETTQVLVQTKAGKDVEEGIQYIIEQNPLIVFVKDVADEHSRCVFRYQTITL